jgi:hypothetical protein
MAAIGTQFTTHEHFQLFLIEIARAFLKVRDQHVAISTRRTALRTKIADQGNQSGQIIVVTIFSLAIDACSFRRLCFLFRRLCCLFLFVFVFVAH